MQEYADALDAAVATEIMGYVKGIKIKHTGAQLWSSGGASFSFHPSCNGEDLHQLLTYMAETGWHWTLSNSRTEVHIKMTKDVSAQSYEYHKMTRSLMPPYEFMERVCETALKAVRAEKG